MMSGSFRRFVKLDQWQHLLRLNGCGRRSLSSISAGVPEPRSVCIVGAGPAGFYTADSLLRGAKDKYSLNVAVIERLPVPFGLVRFGVAPDHAEAKLVDRIFQGLLERDNVELFGNVRVGADVSVDELLGLFDAVVLANGAESDRALGIPGEEVAGVYSSRDFVGWYNGHPDFSKLEVDLQSTDTATVIGNGNVALDIARILARPVDELRKTDISAEALEALSRSRIEQVHVVGRRGIPQASWKAKEVREVVHGISRCKVNLADRRDLSLTNADKEELEQDRSRKRCTKIFLDALGNEDNETASNYLRDTDLDRLISFHFHRSPTSFIANDNGSVVGVNLDRTELAGPPGAQKVVGSITGEELYLSTQLVVKSVGYKCAPISGVPFDSRNAIVPNEGGKVLKVDRLFVSGWLKRGPSGTIPTNKWDAEETSHLVLDRLATSGSHQEQSRSGQQVGLEGLHDLLQTRGVKRISQEGWNRIDEEELRRGITEGRPRAKIRDIEELLRVAHSSDVVPE